MIIHQTEKIDARRIHIDIHENRKFMYKGVYFATSKNTLNNKTNKLDVLNKP